MRFEEALKAMREGKKVRRTDWVRKDNYIFLRRKPWGDDLKWFFVDSTGFEFAEMNTYWIMSEKWEEVEE